MSTFAGDADVQTLIYVLMRRCEFYLSMAALSLKPLSQEQIDTGTEIDISVFGSAEPLSHAEADDIIRYLNMDLEVISDLLEELPRGRASCSEKKHLSS